MRVITAGNSRYRPIVELGVAQAHLMGYDVGLFDLGDLGIGWAHPIEVDPRLAVEGNYKVDEKGYPTKALHKPRMLREAQERYGGSDLLYLDGDAILVRPVHDIFDHDFDVAVTVRPKHERDRTLRMRPAWDQWIGWVNAGVVALADSAGAVEFVHRWAAECDRKGNDQFALNEMVNPKHRRLRPGETWVEDGVRIHALDGQKYNFGGFHAPGYEEASILHLKTMVWQKELKQLQLHCRRKSREFL
ncbi:MAG: putative nucleotide-diphospho-sugar transferase [Planctomycetota bacterium]